MAIFPGSAIPSAVSDYEIDNSLRFETGDSPHLSRTPASASNRKTWTISCWVKLTVGTNVILLAAGSNPNYIQVYITAGGALAMYDPSAAGGANSIYIKTARLLRDPSAWYHIVMQLDTTQATNTDRVKIYVNNERADSFDQTDWPAEDYESFINNNIENTIGETGSSYSSCYQAEYYFIDGTALTPSSFGELSSTTNQWIPKDASDLTFGTNGFYQKYGTPHGIEAFTTAGSHTWTCPTGVTAVEVLTVAGGGGGGGHYYGGGGGAGGIVHASSYAVTAGVVYDITVGGGGAGSSSGQGTNGSDSVWNVNAEGSGLALTAKGGGGGGNSGSGNAGGSGGGGTGWPSTSSDSASNQADFSGATSYGNVGRASSAVSANNYYGAGGGGGAGAAGPAQSGNTGGTGGAGQSFATFSGYGVAGVFGGGGGGSSGSTGGPGPGGTGGGGAGASTGSSAAVVGTANTGGGGGGGAHTNIDGGNGKAGGLGVVLISVDAGLGADSSGEGNNFAVTNLVATDQMIDTPTNNFCTMNPLQKASSSYNTLKEGNLHLEATGQGSAQSTFAMSAGKWYWECLLSIAPTWWPVVGFGKTTTNVGLGNQNYTGEQVGSWGYKSDGGQFYVEGSIAATYTSAGVGDILQFALDIPNNKAWVGINNTWVNSGDPAAGTNAIVTSGLNGFDIVPIFSDADAAGHDLIANFGQDSSFAGAKTAQGNSDSGDATTDFYYTPPTAFLALCTSNLPDPEIALPGENFNTVLYAGNGGGSTDAITGVGFQPDLNWIKGRTNATSNYLTDSVRGIAGSGLLSDSTAASDGIERIASLDSDGFTTAGTLYSYVNTSSANYVAWNWKAGGAPTATNSAGAGATPTAGSVKIDGSNLGSALAGDIAANKLSANTTAGFSIVSWTGSGTLDDTVAHGLSVTPSLFIFKAVTGSDNWPVWHESFGIDSNMYLDTDGALYDGNQPDRFPTLPTASVFTPGNAANIGGTGLAIITYCFHSVEGYSKVGSYIGNGNADGPFIYTGFRPAYIMIRVAPAWSGGHWHLFDTKRYTYNETTNTTTTGLTADNATNDGGGGGEGAGPIDILSNGFKIRNSNGNDNANTDNIIFLAFAESPFKYSNAR